MGQDHQTEAACLLEQGASYHRRIGLKPVAAPGDLIFAGFKQGAFSLYLGDAPIYHFDLDGRWQRAFVDSTHYLKGLDATVQAIDRVREGPNLVLKRTTLTDAAAGDFDARVRSMALELIAGLIGARLRPVEPTSSKAQPLETGALRAFLERISSWDYSAWRGQRERYRAAYGPLPFLPPECTNAIVLQATLGQARGVGFGGSTAAVGLVRSRAEFAKHVHDVAGLWGRRLLQSRAIFLAGNDVLHKPVGDLLAFLSAAGEIFPVEPKARRGTADRAALEHKLHFDGVHAFVDHFDLPRPDTAGWRELAARGLVRISLGVESGDPAVRGVYRKSWDNAELRATVSEAKAAGLGVSVLTLVGAGGVELALGHVEQTSRLIDSLELGAGDFVFLLDENEVRGADIGLNGLTLLERPAWSQQQTKLKDALASLKKRGVKVLPYTMEKQWT